MFCFCVIVLIGCVGIDGLCYKIGEAFKDGCIEYICEKGGDFRMVNFGTTVK